MSGLKKVLAAAAAVALFFVAQKLSSEGFERVLSFRMLERVPLTELYGSTGGEVQVQGWVQDADELLSSPHTQTASVYYRYLVEVEKRDSEGRTSWRKVRDVSQSVNFTLADRSGQGLILAKPKHRLIDWSVSQSYRTRSGKYRYTEWRIEPGHKITVFGWLNINNGRPEISFGESGEYLPIISSSDASSERSDISQAAIIYLWAGVTAMVLMCFAIVYLFRLHMVLVFLSLITAACSGLLIHLGYKSLEVDVEAGYKRTELQRERSEALITQVLDRYYMPFPGWQDAFDMRDPYYIPLTDLERDQINGWRNIAYQVNQRYLAQIDRFPEKPFAFLTGRSQPTPIALPDDQEASNQTVLSEYQSTRVERQLFFTVMALVFAVGLAWFAFRFIKIKRMQENLPTCRTSGVVYGLTELKGTLVAEDLEQCFTAPLTMKPSVWYQYKVEEKRGVGKRSRWVTVLNETKKQAFYCEDEEGKLRVFPKKAEIITKHSSTRSDGRIRYKEKRLEPGDYLYLLGKAKPDHTKGDSLVLSYEKNTPYIIANKSEAEVMFLKASKAMFLLSLGVSLLFGAVLWIGGSSGEFSSIDFVMASLFAPFFLSVLMGVLMYNDLIFLRQRCERNWANINVSLKKRATLLPRLQKVVKRYFEHEKELQQELAKLRTPQADINQVSDVDSYIRHEARMIERLGVTVENYPDLKGTELAQNFHKRLIKLENEIALIRAGFNDAVTHYNTRISSFPDILLSKLFKFKPLSTLSFALKTREVPKVKIQNNREKA